MHDAPGTLRLLCANALAMTGFLSAFVVARDVRVALITALLLAGLGYVASSGLIDESTATRK